MSGLCRWTIICLALAVGPATAEADDPVLFFSDLTSGPRTGNSDTSGGRIPGQDGAIVTLWGRNLGFAPGSAQVFCNGAPAASYYYAGSATNPANLSTYHKMEMIVFQVSHLAQVGPGGIYVVAGGKQSGSLPFTVRSGAIHFVMTSGDDEVGTGSWSQPWRTITKAVDTMGAGDVAYIGHGVNETNEFDASAAVNLRSDGAPGNPKALVVYPGATARVGNPTLERAFFFYDWNNDRFTTDWVIAKFHITTGQLGAPANHGFRVIGNYITAPNGDGMDGAIDFQGNDVFVLGNELDRVGSPNCSKLYHAIYGKGFRTDDPPRAPTESNREIAWNYVHDSAANRGINIYSEQAHSAFIERHAVHDNVIVNQRGDGIMLGYYVVGDNWVYNNLVIRAGLGPEWPDGESYHTGIRIGAGHEAVSNTVVHCYHNTLYACGWSGAVLPGETGHLLVNPEALPSSTVKFLNNVIRSTGEPYLAEESADLASGDCRNCWYGSGVAPAWDTGAVNADPRFVAAGAGDFALSQTSPCLDAGTDVSAAVKRDLLGVPRPQGGGVDLGAFEFAVTFERRLSVLRRPSGVLLTWNGGPGIRLQRTPSLSPAIWTDVNGSDGLSTLEVPLGGLSEFFRLVKP
jgi:hypothetical protein